MLTQKITLAANGDTFASAITFEMFDQQGRLIEPASEATANGERIAF